MKVRARWCWAHHLALARTAAAASSPVPASAPPAQRLAPRFLARPRLPAQAFPRDQLHLVQYESLITKETMPGDLQGLKAFLGPDFDQHLPSDSLPLTNWKHMRGGPDTVSWRRRRGWAGGGPRGAPGAPGQLGHSRARRRVVLLRATVTASCASRSPPLCLWLCSWAGTGI